MIDVSGSRLFVDYEPVYFGGPPVPNCNFVPRSQARPIVSNLGQGRPGEGARINMKVKVVLAFLILRLLRRLGRDEQDKEIYREPSAVAPPGWPRN